MKRKILSLCLACVMIVMAFGATFPAFAEDGTFASDAEAKAAGYVCRIGDEGTGTYYKYFSILDTTYVANKSSEGLTYKKTAIGQHDGINTITLINDVTATNQAGGAVNESGETTARQNGYIQSYTNDVNIDGNGHTYTCCSGFIVNKAYSITVKNLNIVLTGNESIGSVRNTSADLTFENCDFTVASTAARTTDGYFSCLTNNGCNLIIKGTAENPSTVTVQNTEATIPLIGCNDTKNDTTNGINNSSNKTMNVTLEYVNFDTSAAANMKVVNLAAGGNLTITNSSLTSKAQAVGIVRGGNLTITDSTVKSTADKALNIGVDVTSITVDRTVNITDSAIESQKEGTEAGTAAIYMYGTTHTATVNLNGTTSVKTPSYAFNLVHPTNSIKALTINMNDSASIEAATAFYTNNDNADTTTTVYIRDNAKVTATEMLNSNSKNVSVCITSSQSCGYAAPTLLDGASIRTVADSNGLRFTATVGADVTGTYGIMLAKKAELAANAEFTYEAQGDVAKKVDASAENVIDNGDGTKTFNLALTDLPTTELTTEFAARAYATYTVGGSTITVYSAFDEGKNVRSMQGVAEDASTDLNDSAEGIYVCPIQIDENTVKYSPYSQAQYDVIKTYLPA